MRSIRVMAGLLTVLISGSRSEGVAHGLGASQQGTLGMADAYLSLDGLPAGPLSTVLQTQTAAGFDVKLTVAPQLMPPLFYTTWVAPVLQGLRPLKTVRITTFSRTAAGQSATALEAMGVAPKQIDLPALDASSREPLKFSVSFSAPGMHPVQSTTPSYAVQRLPPLLVSNFRLDFQGNPHLDTMHVSKIEAISIGPKGANPALAVSAPKSQTVGGKSLTPEMRTMTGSGGVAISNLVFYVPQAYAVPYQQWLATSPNQTRNGSITYLKPNLTAPWGTLALNGLAITKITTETNPGHDGIHRVKVEMTVSSVQFTLAP